MPDSLEERVRHHIEVCRGVSIYRDEPDPVTAQIDGMTNSEFLELLSTILEGTNYADNSGTT
jgi:hypothetical protein